MKKISNPIRSAEATEQNLMQRWEDENDIKSLTTIFNSHKDAVYRTAKRHVGAEAAEDIVQSVFIHVIQKKVRFPSGQLSAKPLLLGVAINHCKHFHRTNKRRRTRERAVSPAPVSNRLPNNTSEKDQVSDAVVDAVSLLPDQYRRPLELRYMEGLSVAETAYALGVKTNTAQHQILRGLKKLTQKLTAMGITAAPAACIISLETSIKESAPESIDQYLDNINDAISIDPLPAASENDSELSEADTSQSSWSAATKVSIFASLFLGAFVGFNYLNEEKPQDSPAKLPPPFISTQPPEPEPVQETPPEPVKAKPRPLFHKTWDFQKTTHSDLILLDGTSRPYKSGFGMNIPKGSGSAYFQLPVPPSDRTLQVDITYKMNFPRPVSGVYVGRMKNNIGEDHYFWKRKITVPFKERGATTVTQTLYLFGRYQVSRSAEKVSKISLFNLEKKDQEVYLQITDLTLMKLTVRELKEAPFKEEEMADLIGRWPTKAVKIQGRRFHN